MRRSFIVLFSCLTLCCGGSSTPAKGADDAPPPAKADKSDTASDKAAPSAAEAEEPKTMELPTKCADASTEPCLMPKRFVKRLCSEAYPEIALYFFAKDSPWTRAYVAVRQVEPFNGHGGPSSDKNLEFDEELLVLSERVADLGGMSVSGVGNSYDVLRWDGTCATLQAGEVRFRRPPAPKHANVEWRRLNAEVQDALFADDQMKKLANERRSECKGVTMGAVSDKCEKADTALKARVVQLVRDGFQIPRPSAPLKAE